MNESTLVPREEMSDLDWLARNVHKWPDDKKFICYSIDDGCAIFHEHNKNCATWYSKDQWLSRRAELQNKPGWDDAPEWAEFISQSASGAWYWHEFAPCIGTSVYFSVKGKYTMPNAGEVLGDWRDTLEKRPEQVEFEPFVSVEDEDEDDIVQYGIGVAEAKEFLRSLKVGSGSAATAKQPAPKGSGNPILGMVLADLTNRALEGKEKYGEPLLAHNGRNPLWDAYQEALDLAMYLRQAIEEQK